MAVQERHTSKRCPSSTLSVASDGDLESVCQPCDEEGLKLPAFGYCVDCKENLCRGCFTFHRKNKLCRHHTLLDAKGMLTPVEHPLTSTKARRWSDDLITPCFEHSNEIIKFYCKSHKQLLCNICVTLQHTTDSCKVYYIPDISKQFANSKEYYNRLKELDDIIEEYKKIIIEFKEKTARSNNSLTEVLTNIKKFREDVNQRLDEMERQAEDDVKIIQKENENYLKTLDATYADLLKSITLSSNSIQELSLSGQDNKLFVEMKLAEDMKAEAENNIHQLQSWVVNEYDFKPNEELIKCIENEKSVGICTSLPKISSKVSLGQDIQKEPRRFSYQGQVCVKMSRDEDGCQISGITLLAPDIIIVTDQGNGILKMIDINRLLVTDHLPLESSPRDVTNVTSTKIAVTLPKQQKVQFISTLSNTLTKHHAIAVDGDCHGISCYQDKLVVSFYNPAKLQILDMDGKVLTKIINIFRSPLYVATSSSSIFVSDWGTKSVTSLSWKGEVMGSYGGMSFPSGLALSDDGTIFVCDNMKNVIEEIAEDCSAGTVIVKEIKSPYVVCWCAERKELYYCCFTMNDKDDNFLQIYKQAQL